MTFCFTCTQTFVYTADLLINVGSETKYNMPMHLAQADFTGA
jgi:hypothetical protein